MKTARNNIELSIIKTLAYGDVFDFPMTLNEIFKFYIGKDKVSKVKTQRVLESLVSKDLIDKNEGYYFLKGRRKLVETRSMREKESLVKINIAHKISSLLGLIPWIKVIGVSGSLSMRNAKKTDDIDLFIITEKHTLWVTRFLVNVILSITGSKRSRADSYGTNLICPNMFISLDAVTIPRFKRNLFSAHEVTQAKILLNKDQAYELFLESNSWISRYLPNVKIKKNVKVVDHNPNIIIAFLNGCFYVLQFLYMKKRITGEEVKISVARFHPRDKSQFVLALYELRFKEYLSFLRNYRILTYSFV